MKNTTLPQRVNSSLLSKNRKPEDPYVLLLVTDVGATQSYEFNDRNGRSYVCTWDTKLKGHTLRVPLSVWMQRDAQLAKDIMGSVSRYPKVPLFFPGTQPVQIQTEEEKGEETGDLTTQPPEDAPIPSDPVMKDGKLLHLLLAEHVAQGAQRIKAVAHTLQVEEEAVKTAALESDSTVEVATGGWVRLKAAPVATTQPPAQE